MQQYEDTPPEQPTDEGAERVAEAYDEGIKRA